MQVKPFSESIEDRMANSLLGVLSSSETETNTSGVGDSRGAVGGGTRKRKEEDARRTPMRAAVGFILGM